jgi:integrase/recombinase XerD
MFETLFSRPTARQRHREGPLAEERVAYLASLAAANAAHGTLVRKARYCMCLVRELEKWPPHYCFNLAEVDALVAAWGAKRVSMGRASAPRWPCENLRSVAIEFLQTLGRLSGDSVPIADRYDAYVDDFLAAQRQKGWLSEASCRSGRWQVQKFLSYLDNQALDLESLSPDDIDIYFWHCAQRWCRVSIHTAAKVLRTWFRHCEVRGWIKPGLADAILLPRLYRHEGLPPGPTWDDVTRMLAESSGDNPADLRNHAILLIVSVYGLRSGEVRRLTLDDIDWQHNRLRVIRSKSSREHVFPLEPRVGNAIARYLRDCRPKISCRVLFLTLLAPYRPLSPGALYYVVQTHLPRQNSPQKGRGPHGLRHACARHLMEAGLTFKHIGDHLGHRSPDATRLYAKIDLASLRKVALEDMGGLS